MNDEVIKQGTEAPKNKYELVGGNKVNSNPFGADPENHEARTAKADRAMDSEESSVEMVKEVYDRPVEVTHRPERVDYVKESEVAESGRWFHLNPVLVVAVASLLVLGTCWMLGVFKKPSSQLDGSYRFSYIETRGEVFTPAQLEALGARVNNTKIEIDGDSAKLTVFGFTGNCELEKNGDRIKITNGDKSMSGRSDIGNGEVILEHNGVDMVFEKE